MRVSSYVGCLYQAYVITDCFVQECGCHYGRLCHSTWLFCFSNILKIYAFSPNFPLVGSVIGGFYWLFLWNFKEIKHQPFSMTQPPTKGISHGFRQGENQMKRLSPRCGDETPPCCDRAKRKNFRKGHPRQSPRLPPKKRKPLEKGGGRFGGGEAFPQKGSSPSKGSSPAIPQ